MRALTTRTDLKKNRAFPNSSKDMSGKLLVGAAVRASSRDVIDYDRIAALYAAGCNIIVLDAQVDICTLHGSHLLSPLFGHRMGIMRTRFSA